MDYRTVRKEQLEKLILQYQDMLFVQEQKNLLLIPNTRSQHECEQEIKRLRLITEEYKKELKSLLAAEYKEGTGNGHSNGHYGLTPMKRSVIFEDDFYNNYNNWWVGENDRIKISIQNGCFSMTSKRPDGRIIWYDGRPLSFSSKQDFEVELAISLKKNVGNYGFGFVWGNNRDNFYDFCLSANGYFTLGNTIDGKWHEIHPWEYNTSISVEDDFNYIKMQKKDSVYRFYINQVFVLQKSLPEEPSFHEEIGFVVYRDMEIMVDFLRIVRL